MSRSAGPTNPHGTPARFHWEMRNLGHACASCREARNAYERERNRKEDELAWDGGWTVGSLVRRPIPKGDAA